MKILVTGATGFIGSHLIDRLLKLSSFQVIALVRHPSRLKRVKNKEKLILARGDLFNLPSLPSDLSIVLHLAGVTKASRSSDYYTGNREGTASLFQHLDNSGAKCRVICLSSVAAAGPARLERPRKEEDEPEPVSHYGKSKLEAEKVALAYRDRFQVIILRPTAIYGPGDEDFLEYFRWVKRGIIPLFGFKRKEMNLCFIDDLIEAIMVSTAWSENSSGEIFNIAHPQLVTWEEIGKLAAKTLAKKAYRLKVPDLFAFFACASSQAISMFTQKPTAINLSKYRDMKPTRWVVDVAKAGQKLGFEARTEIEQGIYQTIDWYRQENLL